MPSSPDHGAPVHLPVKEGSLQTLSDTGCQIYFGKVAQGFCWRCARCRGRVGFGPCSLADRREEHAAEQLPSVAGLARIYASARRQSLSRPKKRSAKKPWGNCAKQHEQPRVRQRGGRASKHCYEMIWSYRKYYLSLGGSSEVIRDTRSDGTG